MPPTNRNSSGSPGDPDHAEITVQRPTNPRSTVSLFCPRCGHVASGWLGPAPTPLGVHQLGCHFCGMWLRVTVLMEPPPLDPDCMPAPARCRFQQGLLERCWQRPEANRQASEPPPAAALPLPPLPETRRERPAEAPLAVPASRLWRGTDEQWHRLTRDMQLRLLASYWDNDLRRMTLRQWQQRLLVQPPLPAALRQIVGEVAGLSGREVARLYRLHWLADPEKRGTAYLYGPTELAGVHSCYRRERGLPAAACRGEGCA